MTIDSRQKEQLKNDLISCLREDSEIIKIVVFGSFLSNPDPPDMDVAVFQDSNEPYLALALKYRKQAGPVSQRIPLDIIPVRSDFSTDAFLEEIERGETIYAR